jgi:hypothetical protein
MSRNKLTHWIEDAEERDFCRDAVFLMGVQEKQALHLGAIVATIAGWWHQYVTKEVLPSGLRCAPERSQRAVGERVTCAGTDRLITPVVALPTSVNPWERADWVAADAAEHSPQLAGTADLRADPASECGSVPGVERVSIRSGILRADRVEAT